MTVVAWDAPGCGESSDPPELFGAHGYAGALASFMAELEIETAHVLGLSWGGGLAQELYRLHPERVRSLILADTYAGWRGSLPEDVCDARLASCLRESELPPEEFIPGWIRGLLSDRAEPRLRDELVEIMSSFHPSGYRAMAHAFAHQDTRDLLPRIDVPTLLIWGEADARSPVTVAKQMGDGIPGSRLVLIPDAGHVSSLEAPEPFNEAVLSFVGALE